MGADVAREVVGAPVRSLRSAWPSALLALALVAAHPRLGARAEEPTAPPARIRLTDVTQAAGLAEAGGDRLALGDYDRDGDPDLLIGGDRLWRNDTPRTPGAQIRFVDVSQESGLRAGGGGGGFFVDVDNDGRLDVVTLGGAVKLQIEPGRFEDRRTQMGLPADMQAASLGAADINGDGFVDLLYGGGEKWENDQSFPFPRFLFLGQGGKAFVDDTRRHALGEARYGRSVVFADYDMDGDLDAYLGNYRLQPNELLINESGRLLDQAGQRGVAGRNEPERYTDATSGKRFGPQYGHTIAASWADLDGDGDLDLWVSNLVHKYVGPWNYQGKEIHDIRGYICDDSAIYRNDGAPDFGFTDMRETSGIPVRPIGPRGVFAGDELWSNAACGDLDGDGLPEVFVTQVYDLEYSHSLLFKNGGQMRFEDISADVGLRRFNSYGGALGDLDGDGDLDLVCAGGQEPKGPRGVCIMRNDTEPGPWIAFVASPGPCALGLQVRLQTDKGPLVRQLEATMGSHAQQNEGVLRFGLRGRTLEGVSVRWPGQAPIELPLPGLGRVVELRRPPPPR